MKVSFLDLKAQYAIIRDEVKAAVNDVLESQQFVLGKHVAALESQIAQICGATFAIGVGSGTDALLLSLKALGIGPGDSVVTTPYSFFATAGAIWNLGARPLFADIQEPSFNLDPDRLATLLARDCGFNLSTQKLVHKSSGTTVKAIVPVHLYGQCADMDDILRIGRRYHLPVVEDACQAIGACYGDAAAGSMGDLGCFSFFPSKNIGGAGDGGMVVTSNRELADRVRLLRTHGASPKYFHARIGFNSRLDEVQAAILRVKLKFLWDWSHARQEKAMLYDRLFAERGLRARVLTPSVVPGRTHVFHQYVIRCRKRDALRAHLQEKGVETEVYYPRALHEQECFLSLGYEASEFPHARAASQQTLALPIYPELRSDHQEYLVACVDEFYSDEKD